jgi:hypothetical protein
MLGVDTKKEIAQTIINQIKYADVWFLPSIGATGFKFMDESKEFQGGLRFSCNGLVHKGYVEVLLKWIDTYTVRFIDLQNNVVKSVNDVYCDELVPVIDYVEGR